MSTIIGYFCTNSALTSDALDKIEPDFEEPEDHSSMGYAWVQEGRTLTRKQPTKPGQHISALSLMSDIPSRSLVGHIDTRDATVSAPQIQPFGFRQWVWAEAGATPELEEHLEDLREQLPDYIARNIQGETLSEVLFHSFMAILHSKDGATARKFRTELASQTAGELYHKLEELTEEEVSFQFTAASDRLLVAGNFSEDPIHYRLIEGIEKQIQEPMFSGHEPKRRQHPRFKALFVSNSISSDTSSEWKRLASDTVLTLDKDWEIELDKPLDSDGE